MKHIYEQIIIRNFKKIPYFFERNNMYTSHNNYALIGKLSTSLLHDVLSPLTSLLITQEIAKDTSTQNIKPIIEHSNHQIKEYVAIMKDFLQEDVQNSKPILINSEIKKCITLLKHKTIRNNVQIQFIEFDQVHTQINPLHVYQIVINLLTNAIEASVSSQNKKVVLIIKKQKDKVVIECKDFGCGIPSNIKNKIGTYNFSTKSSTRGFGLYSLQYIVSHLLKGSFAIESEEGVGSLFTCTLPIIK